LAVTYYNLALLQENSLNDLSSAEDNYNKAIEIGERIRKTDNPKSEYLNLLAKAYIAIAVIQKNREDYDAAKRNVEEAIKIEDSIKYENIQYLVNWLVSKRNYADILVATGNPDAARVIINEIKPIAEEWVEKIPNYDYLKRVYGAIKVTESKLDF
jgi:tetratricopeptide (TPR) repeat protein